MSWLTISASVLARRSGRGAGRRLLSSGNGPGGGADPPPPGSAASLLDLLESHRNEWDPRLSPRARWQQERRGRGGRRASRFPSGHGHPQDPEPLSTRQRRDIPPYAMTKSRPGELPDRQHRGLPPQPRSGPTLVRPSPKPRPQKTAAALGLSHDRRSREITARVVAAYANAEAQLASSELSRKDKVAAAQRCILSLTRFASLPLSDINLAAVMHRTCRLATHERLRADSVQDRTMTGAQAWYPDLGQESLLRGLWGEVVARARLQLARIGDGGAGTSNEEAAGLQRSWAGSSLGEPPPGVHSSTAAMAVYSIGAISLSVPREELDVVSEVIMADKAQWSDQRIIMIALALGRLGAQPLEGALHAALVAEAAPRLANFAGEEISTLLWGLGHALYHPGDAFITAAAAAMAPKAETLRPVGVLNALDGLSSLGWVVPPPPKSEIEGLAPWTPAEVEAAVAAGGRAAAAAAAQNEQEDRGSRVLLRDLRELQSLAREWERERRRGLAALLQEGGGDAGWAGAAPAPVPAAASASSAAQSTEFSLTALAQQALRARAERDSVAQLRREADRVARELRAAAEATAVNIRNADSSSEDSGFCADGGSGSGSGRRSGALEELEDDEILVERLLTGAWPQQAPPAEPPGLGGDAGAMAVPMPRRRHGRRVLRLGPLLAEAMVHPDSGITVIQPTYDRELLLWGPPPSAEAATSADGGEGHSPSLSGAAGQETVEETDEEDITAEILEEQASAEAAALEALAAGDAAAAAAGAEDAGADSDEELPPTEEASAVAAAGAAVDVLVRRAAGMLPTLRPDQATTLARHAALLRHVDVDFMLAIRAKIAAALASIDRPEHAATAPDADAPTTSRSFLSSISLADFLWSFASLGVPELMPEPIARRAAAALLRDPDCPPTALGRCVWSLAVLGHLDSSTLRAVGDKLLEIAEDRGLGLEGLVIPGYRGTSGAPAGEALGEKDASIRTAAASRALTTLLSQFFQAALTVEMATGETALEVLPEALRAPATAAWQERFETVNPSSLQRQVASALRASGLQCALEYVPPDSPVIIDIAVFDSGADNGLAVEVDGPSHFATNRRTHPLGATRLRDALLRHCGWAVVTVPYFEWIVLQGQRQQAWYIETKIVGALKGKKPGPGAA